MSANNVKITFNEKNCQIKLSVSREFVRKNPCPDSILRKAETKMKELKNEGRIESYEVFEKKLRRAWMSIQTGKTETKADLLTLIIAEGKQFEGFRREKTNRSEDPPLSTIDNDIPAQKELGDYPGKGLIKVRFSTDLMEATITNFDLKVYEDHPECQFDEEWLKMEFQRFGFVELREDHGKRILENARRRQDLNQLAFASGYPGAPGEIPYLVPGWMEDGECDPDMNLEELDTKILEKGELVARIAFKTKPIPAKDVFGRLRPAPVPEGGNTFDVGEGLEEKDWGFFYATIVGMPVFCGNKVSVSRALIIKGDVTASSQSIHYDGPVRVLGGVEHGGCIVAQEDIFIGKAVQGGILRSGGSITVKGGVITGKDGGYISAKNHITAHFIENSVVFAGGNIKVARSVINSRVIVGGDLITSEHSDGIVGGGHISCEGSLETYQLGFDNGTETQIDLGHRAKKEISLKIKKNRLMKLEKYLAVCELDLKELRKKLPLQMTDPLKERKSDLIVRSRRTKKLIERCQNLIGICEAGINYNSETKMIVLGPAFDSCTINICGKNLAFSTNLHGIVVLSPKVLGKEIISLEEYKSIVRKKESAS